MCHNASNNTATTSSKLVSAEQQQLLWGSLSFTVMKCLASSLNGVFNGQSFPYVLVYHFTTMHVRSHRSYCCLVCSSSVNISEPVFYLIVILHLTVSQLELPNFQIPTTMLNSQSSNTSLLEMIISSKNEHVLICDLSDLGLQIIFDRR